MPGSGSRPGSGSMLTDRARRPGLDNFVTSNSVTTQSNLKGLRRFNWNRRKKENIFKQVNTALKDTITVSPVTVDATTDAAGIAPETDIDTSTKKPSEEDSLEEFGESMKTAKTTHHVNLHIEEKNEEPIKPKFRFPPKRRINDIKRMREKVVADENKKLAILKEKLQQLKYRKPEDINLHSIENPEIKKVEQNKLADFANIETNTEDGTLPIENMFTAHSQDKHNVDLISKKEEVFVPPHENIESKMENNSEENEIPIEVEGEEIEEEGEEDIIAKETEEVQKSSAIEAETKSIEPNFSDETGEDKKSSEYEYVYEYEEEDTPESVQDIVTPPPMEVTTSIDVTTGTLSTEHLDDVYKNEIGLMKLKDTTKVERDSEMISNDELGMTDESQMKKNSGFQMKNDKKSSFLNKDKIHGFFEKNISLKDNKFPSSTLNLELSNAFPHLELKPIPGDQISVLPENLLNSILGTHNSKFDVKGQMLDRNIESALNISIPEQNKPSFNQSQRYQRHSTHSNKNDESYSFNYAILDEKTGIMHSRNPSIN
ncbi:uncharacterized protein LOC111718404 [Eurytemora carolleeae]|uniref:uncharacterized protein LOC111718404 n=1 Tax=Eurytemora carolleeae TaxID=1294199 RepID=UPI000C7811FF|nr:uncharacterized protein LOC111718404 [Eurytemora carolleeae]|eukprot:XP_023349749.1 uncharacterized protein LOC111718404 [Eurytemora affinis]